jgi:hypothetical protein
MPDEDSKQLQEELKQPAAEEIGYGKISDNLMLQGFGQWLFCDQSVASDQSVIFWDREITCHYFYTNWISLTRTYYSTLFVSEYI